MTTIERSSASENLAHFSDAQRDFIRLRAADDLRHGRPATLRFRNGVELSAVLKTFDKDRSDDLEGSLALDLQHVATKSEVARSIAGRLGLQFDAPPISLDEAVAMELKSLADRKLARV